MPLIVKISAYKLRYEETDKYASYLDGGPREVIFKGDYIFHLTDGSRLNPSSLN